MECGAIELKERINLKKKFLSIIICIVILSCIFSSGCFEKNKTHDKEKLKKVTKLMLEISMEKTFFKINESINLTIVLQNVGNESVRVEPLERPNEGNIKYYLINSTGVQLQNWVGWDGEGLFSEEHIIDLEPNESISKTFDILHYSYFNLSTGNYSIHILYSPRARYIDVWGGTLYSNILYFTVFKSHNLYRK